MRKNLLSFFLLISICAGAQSLVLTQAANEPAVGDMDSGYGLDTTLYTTGLNVSNTGTNTVWDYTRLQATNPMYTTNYIAPGSDTSAVHYPGCTVIQDDGVAHTYLKSTTTPTTQTEVLGIIASTLSLTFTNSAIAAKYPVSLGSTVTDNISGSFSGFSINGTCAGNISTTADGSGTLMLPGGITLTNVLRVKSVQTLTASSGFLPLATIRQTGYSFYHSSKKFAVLSINYSKIAFTGQTPNTSGGVTGNSSLFTVGLKENTLSPNLLSVYPNPVTGSLTMEISEQFHPKEIKLYTQLGQLAFQSAYTKTIDLSVLPAGIYFMELATEQGIVRKKLIKE